MSTNTDQAIEDYIAAYQATYDRARAGNHGPDVARYAASRAADAAFAARERTAASS
jgi:hypothetical protein